MNRSQRRQPEDVGDLPEKFASGDNQPARFVVAGLLSIGGLILVVLAAYLCIARVRALEYSAIFAAVGYGLCVSGEFVAPRPARFYTRLVLIWATILVVNQVAYFLRLAQIGF